MPSINLRPEFLGVIQVVKGTDVWFILDFEGEDLSGDTYEPIVEVDCETSFTGTGSVTGTQVLVEWTKEQTEAMGTGTHQWKLWRTRSGKSVVPVAGPFEVVE